MDPFPDRPAGKLSGGMKQKVGLCGALIHDPDLLILDEPTTGVDPLSRQQFWTLIDHIRAGRPGMSVLVSTAYMDEAQRFDWTIAMDAGRVHGQRHSRSAHRDAPARENLEETFVALLPGKSGRAPRTDGSASRGQRRQAGHRRQEPHEAVRQLHRGEQRQLHDRPRRNLRLPRLQWLWQVDDDENAHGLLPASSGEAKLFGETVDAGGIEIRNRVGYMSQAFSLYGELTVAAEPRLHAGIFHLPPRMSRRIDDWSTASASGRTWNTLSESLPLGSATAVAGGGGVYTSRKCYSRRTDFRC